ncbi:peptidylprolyl isomerase [Clostridiaceae bacterium OttesenSCG-928-D20]|nr:peptidylprolyl isomerase [Clostridiaceae bacterium OttesenSCG-928-D20]
MSASKQKKKRQEELLNPPSHKVEAEKKELAKKKRDKITAISVAAFLILLIVFVVALNSNLFYTVLPSITVGNESLNNAEYNYYFNTTYNNYYNQVYQQFGEYASMFLPDRSKPLSSQERGDGESWGDYFDDMTFENIKQTSFLYDEAKKADFKLSDEGKETVEETIISLKDQYESMKSDFNSFNSFLTAYYGKGVKEPLVRRLLEENQLAYEYSDYLIENYGFTDEDFEAYYEENKDDNDVISYYLYSFDGSLPEPEEGEEGPSDEEKAEAMSEAKEKADALLNSVLSGEDFDKAVLEVDENASESSYELKKASGANLKDQDYTDWILDGSRKKGDASAIEGETGYTVVLFEARNDNHYKTKNVRHILIKAEENDEYVITDEAKEEAKKEAERILAEFEEGEMTEDSFAELANEYSEDGGSNTVGGLYENVPQGQMVEAFNDYIYDAGRKAGDTGIIFNEGSYTGYHVMYFVGDGDVYSTIIAKNGLENETYNNYIEEGIKNYEIKKHFSFRFSK